MREERPSCQELGWQQRSFITIEICWYAEIGVGEGRGRGRGRGRGTGEGEGDEEEGI